MGWALRIKIIRSQFFQLKKSNFLAELLRQHQLNFKDKNFFYLYFSDLQLKKISIITSKY
jgi:hypothetical protein